MQTARQLIAEPRVLVAAHRGNSVAEPENTLPAFAAAMALGADMVELDYRHSSDGVPMVFHDEDLDRHSDAARRWGLRKARLADKSAAELAQLDAGSWRAPQFAGTRIPTLEQALDLIAPGAVTLVERKAGDAATLIELLCRKNLAQRVVVMAFDWSFLADCRRLAPELAICALGHRSWSPTLLDQLEPLAIQAVGWDDHSTTPDLIDAVHHRNWKAWVWTVDSLERSRTLIAHGIDVITTNVPARLIQMLADE